MKKFFLPVIALSCAIALSAFTSSHQTKKTGDQLWYDFNGGDETVAGNYFIRGNGSTPPPCEASTSNRCAVLATPNQGLGSNYPDLSDPDIAVRNKP